MTVKLKAPNGVTVNAPEEQAARLCEFGFSKVEAAKPKTRARSKKTEEEAKEG